MPISFISEHIEVLLDNDIECLEVCEEVGAHYHRPSMPNVDARLIDALYAAVQKAAAHPEYVWYQPETTTFNEMQPTGASAEILADDSELQMPEFVKRLIEKKGRDKVKMPAYIRKMLEKAGKLPKQ